jgi:hypothetical protein
LEDDGAAENFISEQIAATKGKFILGLIGWDSFAKLNTKNLENSPSFLLHTHTVHPTNGLKDTKF